MSVDACIAWSRELLCRSVANLVAACIATVYHTEERCENVNKTAVAAELFGFFTTLSISPDL